MTNFHPQMTLPQVVAIDGQLFYVAPNQSFLAAAAANRSPFSLQAAQFQAAQQQMHTQAGLQTQGAHHQIHQQQLQLQQAAQQHLQQLQLPAQQPEPEVDLSIDNDFDFSTTSQQQQLEHQHQQQQTPQIRQTPPVAKTNDRVKTKVKNIKSGNYIGHYIDSQLIIETPEPLRVKTKKKKKKLLATNQNSANIQVDFAKQQQQVVLSNQQQRHDITQPLMSPPVVGPTPSSSAGHIAIQDVTEESTTTTTATATTTAAAAVNTIDSDILRIREQMKSWSVADVVNFIESHDAISAYSAKFTEDEIDGTALLYMIDRNLNIQVLSTMFKYGPAMKIEATLSKYKLKE